jgi:hypothetical protein
MNTHPTVQKLQALVALTLAAVAPSSFAQPLTIPGADGSDGALIVTASTNIDLSLAVTGVWSNNNAGNAGKGIYDPDKWAVVFKYTSVSIASGATVTFSNHLTHAPVVWLVSSNVTIDGTLSLDGQPSPGSAFVNPEPGPGGFRGGAYDNSAYGLGQGPGYGPGGVSADRGSYSTYHSYGNARIVPLIGGSGGGPGGGGGGAILMAASGDITVNGLCRANNSSGGYPGSGGAIRCIANQISGAGRFDTTAYYPGRVRIETTLLSPTITTDPPTVAAPPTPVVLWPDAAAPTVKVVSVAGLNVPPDPKASMTPPFADLTLENKNAVTIMLQTQNFSTNGTVNVYIKPHNTSQSILPATYVSGNASNATWQVTTTLQPNYTVIQARVFSD